MSELVTIEAPDTTELDQAANTIVQRAEAFEVIDAPTYKIGAQHTLDCRKRIKAVKALFQPAKSAANAAHKSVCELENKCLGPFKAAQAELDGKMGVWRQQEAERVRREQEAAEREPQRLAAEQARKAEELRQAHMPEAAEAMVAAEPPPPAPVILSDVPKVAGISHREVWKARIVNEAQIKRAYLQPNIKAIDAAARSMGKIAEEQVGGIEVYKDTTTAGRTR